MQNRHTAPSLPFHGWKILFLATFSQFVSVGFSLYLIGLYLEPLAKTFSASAGQIGWASSIFMLVAAGLGPLLGYWADRGHVKILMTLGAFLIASGFALLSVCASLLQAALICAFLIAPGIALHGIVTAGAMLTRWFEQRRGLAIGIAAAGMSLGGFFMPPVAAFLFDSFGWRTSSQVFGIFIALTLLPCAWFIAVAKPSDIGQFADGIRPDEDKRSNPPENPSPVNISGLLRRRDFWMITLTIGTINFASISIVTYLIPFSREQGIELQTSAFMLSFYAGTAFFGKFLYGWLADKFSPARLLTSITATMSLSLIPVIYFNELSVFVFSIFLSGLGVGGLIPIWTTLISRNFGQQAFGKVKGSMSLVLTVVTVTPGPLGGYLHEWQGSYSLTFSVVVWVLILGIAVSLFIPGNSNKSAIPFSHSSTH